MTVIGLRYLETGYLLYIPVGLEEESQFMSVELVLGVHHLHRQHKLHVDLLPTELQVTFVC